MKLLVPVDGSAASLNAVRKAIEIANKCDFSIKLVSVISKDSLRTYKRNEKIWRQVNGSIISNKTADIEEDELFMKMTSMQNELLDSMKMELDFGSIEVDQEVLLGEPYEKILEIAEKEKVDLIVMGNRGFSKIKRFFVGSVAQRVISEAKCPVLVIHTDADDE